MTIDELAKELNIDYTNAYEMNDVLEGVGFTEDQMIAIMKCIVAWAKR